MKQETFEEIKVIKRTELYNSILSIVKQIPRKEVDGDAVDAPSCAYELEQLFLKWQQERSYSFDELRLWLIERDVYLYNYYTTYKKSGIPMENVDKYIEDSHEYLMGRKQFKKK